MVPTCNIRQLRCTQALDRRFNGLQSRFGRAVAAAAASAATHAGRQQQQQQAVVIGSGMAGLAAAEVLSRHFDHVMVLERDQPHPEWEKGAVDMAKVCCLAR